MHDLSYLFDKLPDEIRQQIQANWTAWNLFEVTAEMTFSEFVEQHKDDFVQWRYLTGARMESAYFGLFAATNAVNRATRAAEADD